MFKAVILMQLRVIKYSESKKSAVFVLFICTYKQSLNELQQPNLTGIVGTNNIYVYSFATQPWLVISNASFQWLIYKYHLHLGLSLSIFISLKYQRQTSGGCSRELIYDFMNGNCNLRPTYWCGGEDQKSVFQSVPTALYALRWICRWLSTSFVGYASVRRWRSKND